MKRGLFIAAILIASAYLVAGTFRPARNFSSISPVAPVLTGQENAEEIIGRGQQFLRKAKSTSYKADYVIEANQNGVAVPLFPAEFSLNYSSTLDKYLYEVTSPSAAVGSALLIHRRPTLTARNTSPGGVMRNASLGQDYAPAEVADGCSGSIYDLDQNCYDCGGGMLLVSNKHASQKPSSTFMKLANSGAFDLPYLTDFSPSNAEKINTVAHKGEMSSVVRFARTQASGVGLKDILMTVRHRDGAPVAFDFINSAGETSKHIEASYVGSELTGLTAVDNEQKLELHITLKSMGSVNRNVKLDDSDFTRENLKRILGKKGRVAE